MTSAFCTLWLLTTVTGAEAAGVAHVSDLGTSNVGLCLACQTAVVEPSGGIFARTVMGHAFHVPVPLLYVDTSCSMRWYTAANAAYHKRPYNYLIQFDYPWHPVPRCAVCTETPVDEPPLSHALLAPLVAEDDLQEMYREKSRPSAIRNVD